MVKRLLSIHQPWYPSEWFNTRPSQMRSPKPACMVPVNLTSNCEFLQPWNLIFTTNRRRFHIHLVTDRYLWLSSSVPSSQKGLNNISYFDFKTPSFPQFLMAVVGCYNSWKIPLVFAMHDGQTLMHPLHGTCLFPYSVVTFKHFIITRTIIDDIFTKNERES